MKKGFTLIELLGVIVIITVIATIAVIAVDNSIRKGKITTCKAQEDSIIEAAKTWQTDNPITNTQNKPVSELISGGYLEEGLKNPINDKTYVELGAYVTITVTKEGNMQGYEYSIGPNSAKCEN